jgi:multisubunit Na+/H+ antiporter MnhC subunit
MKKNSTSIIGIAIVSFFLSITCVIAEQNNTNNAYAGISFFDFFMIFLVASGFFIFLRKNYMKSYNNDKKL